MGGLRTGFEHSGVTSSTFGKVSTGFGSDQVRGVTSSTYGKVPSGSGFKTGFEPKGATSAIVPSGPATAAMRRSGGGGGVFGWLGSKLSLAGHDIAQMPGGAYQVGKAAAHDAAKLATHIPGGSSPYTRRAGKGHYELPGVAEGLGKSALQSLEHPLRDPFQTGLTLAPGIGALGKFGEAGLAARGADVAAGESRLGEAARALVRRHGQQPPRTLKMGSKETTLIPSRNAAVRLAQRGYDAALQHALDAEASGQPVGGLTAKLASHGAKRISGALAEEQRIAQRMRSVPNQLLDRAALKLSKTPFRQGSKLHQAALELTSAQTTPEEAALYHEAQAAAGVNPAQNAGVAKLYRRVAKNDLVHLDESRPAGEKVFVNPAHEKLAAADAALSRVQTRGEQIVSEHGLMNPEGQVARINAPAQVRAGAEYVNPTPGRLGVPSDALTAARAERDALASAHENALQAEEAWLKGQQTRSLGPLTEHAARARLAKLDAAYEKLIQNTVPHVSPFADRASEQLRRNFVSGTTGKKMLAVAEEERQLADAAIRHAVETRPHDPAVKVAAKALHERDILRAALQSNAEAPIFGGEGLPFPEGNAAAHGLPLESNPYRDTIVTLAHRLEAAQANADRLEASAANRVEPTGLVGGEGARPGRGFVPYRTSEKAGTPGAISQGRSPVVGAAKSPLDSKAFTGEAIRQGLIPENITRAAGRHYAQLVKFVNTDALRRAALETGSDVRRSARDVLVRQPDVPPEKLTAEIRQALGQERSTVGTVAERQAGTEEGLRALHSMFVQKMLDKVDESHSYEPGMAAPRGYRWVDQHAIQGLQDAIRAPATGAPAKLGRGVDNLNSAITALTVYFKIGHAGTRYLTNAATNLMQGSLKPLDIARSFRLWKSLSTEDKARFLAASGQHGFAALPHEGSGGLFGRGISAVASKGAQGWARYADAPFRFNALAYELRRAGYMTPDAIRRALDGLQSGGHGLPAHEWSAISAAARRADREAIAYDRLSPFERRFLTRAIWFYPWVKGASLFTVRTFLEHPWKAATLGNLGVQGREAQLRELGAVPSYEQGLISLGGGANPLTTDFSTFSPFATAGQVLQTPTEPGALSGNFSPALGAAGSLSYGVNQYGDKSGNPFLNALTAALSPTPEYQLGKVLAGHRGSMFPMTPESEIFRYLVGPAMPRRYHKAVGQQAARGYRQISIPK